MLLTVGPATISLRVVPFDLREMSCDRMFAPLHLGVAQAMG